ncbi:Diguanylate cyclase, GGDEF domain [uncultured archaeon]|nr:Diguanylate cyclase, GGDEF domain [uncultured archaeon]
MLPSFVKTDIWRELMETLSAKLKVPIVCEQAVFGKLSFFQELRNRKTDTPYSQAPGIRYVSVEIDGAKIHAGPFKADEAHTFDEELADAREKLPAWKDNYAEILEISIKQAAVSGRNAHTLNEALNRSKLLLEFSQAIGHSQDAEKALFTAVQFLAYKFKLNNVFISAYGKYSRHFDISEAGKAVEQRIVAQVKGTKTTCTIQNIQTDFLLEGIKDREKLNKYAAGFPLVFNRELVGYVVVNSENTLPIDDISEVLYELTRVLSRLSQYEKVQESAVTDALTGLSNRAELVKKFDDIHSKLAKTQQPISVMMLDIDNFKKYNDTQGHPEGDRVLKAVAEIIKNATPKESISCRYGGEEFMMVMPFEQQKAKETAEQIRADIEKTCPLTVSIGIMTCMNSSVSRETLVREADRALYRAKELGKNKVIAYLTVDKALGIIDT